jgi:spore coat protein JB
VVERDALLRQIQICDFALNDAALFLDTHPDDAEGLAFYKKYSEMRKKAVADYAAKHGPITQADYDGGPSWSWTDGPWPWQYGEA